VNAPADLLIVGGPEHGSFAGPTVSMRGYLQTNIKVGAEDERRVWLHMSLFATGAEVRVWRDAMRLARMSPDAFG